MLRAALKFVMTSDDLCVLSANCQGLGDLEKRTDVLNYFNNCSANILCLQDTHWTDKLENALQREWEGDIAYSGLKSNARGVAILIKHNFEYKILNTHLDHSGNLMTISIETNNTSIKIINLYAPNNDNPAFFENILEIIDNNEMDYFLVCGDFNLTLDPNLDSYNYKNINNPLA